MRKQNFPGKIKLLIDKVREKGELSVGEACLLLQVGPWQVKQYAQAVGDLADDIRFNGKRFETIITPVQKLARELKLDAFNSDRTP